MYKEVFVSRIIQARKECGYTQREASEKLGISKSTIASYEVGRTEPDLETIGKLSKLYCHTVDYFLGLADD